MNLTALLSLPEKSDFIDSKHIEYGNAFFFLNSSISSSVQYIPTSCKTADKIKIVISKSLIAFMSGMRSFI